MAVSAERIIVRDSRPDEAAFIVSTWMRAWKVSPYAGCIPNHLYREVQRTLIEQLVLRGATFKVAVTSERPRARILGFVCRELTRQGEAVVHFLYCREAYISLGVLERLVEEVVGSRPIRYTHRTKQVLGAIPEGRWTPEIARRKA